MIDVFMLVKEGILLSEGADGRIPNVVFCESMQEDFPEIIELLGVEGGGFPLKLEELVLFEDDSYTRRFPTLDSISREFDTEGESLHPDKRDRLRLKQQHIEFARSFPYDLLNLDFCGYYYPPPPHVLDIARTVEKILAWQHSESREERGHGSAVHEFALCVTCRFDGGIPLDALRRLEDLVNSNAEQHADYADVIRSTGRGSTAQEWRESDAFDFFMSAWPKDLLSSARAHGWNMEIQSHVYYDRPGGYRIACVIAHFSNGTVSSIYTDQAVRLLDPLARVFIEDIGRTSELGQRVYSDLADIVRRRNVRARVVDRAELPLP
jgi:hypothetical protein